MTYDPKVCHASFTRVIEAIEKADDSFYGSSAAHFQVFKFFTIQRKALSSTFLWYCFRRCCTYYFCMLSSGITYIIILSKYFAISGWLRFPGKCFISNWRLPYSYYFKYHFWLLITKYTPIYNTRNANNHRPYFCRTNIKQFTILHLGSKLCVKQ